MNSMTKTILAALAILAWDTNQLFSPGFQFSFVLVIVIVWLSGKIQHRLEPLAVAAAGKLFAVGLIGAAFLAASVLPLSTTPLATVAMLSGIAAWNEFFWPFIVAPGEDSQVLPVALQHFKSQTPQGQPDWTGLMAATALTVLPTLALLVIFGRRVVESVQFSGSK